MTVKKAKRYWMDKKDMKSIKQKRLKIEGLQKELNNKIFALSAQKDLFFRKFSMPELIKLGWVRESRPDSPDSFFKKNGKMIRLDGITRKVSTFDYRNRTLFDMEELEAHEK